MSKETTPTTTEQWIADYSHANGLTPRAGHSIDSTYAFLSEDLVDSRMVINPYATLVTEGIHTEAPASDATDSQAATESATDAPEETAKGDQAPDESATAPQTVAAPTETLRTPGKKDTLRSRISAKLGRLAERLMANKKEGRVKRGLSDAANKLFTYASKTSRAPKNNQTTDPASNEQAQTAVFRETARAEREQKNKSRNGLFSKMGGVARRWWKRTPDAPTKANSTPEVTKKDVKKGAWGVGAVAVAAAAAVLVGPFGQKAEAIQDAKDNDRLYSYDNAAVVHAVEVHKNVNKTVTVVGGNYQDVPDAEFVEANLEQGVNVQALQYDANMGLDGSGPGRAQHSAVDGSVGLRQAAERQIANGQEWQAASYSWGNTIVAQAYYDAKMTNPELYRQMSEAPPVMYNGPFGGGGFDGPYGKIAMAMFGVNPEIRNALPKGTTFVYGERDPFSTSTYGNQPLTSGFNALLTAVGSHERREIDEAYITIEDDEGNFHKIAPFDAAAALGITGAGNAEINDAINKLFPINHDPDSTVRPKADVIGAILSGAKGLDRMIDPTGNVRVFEMIQAQIPMEWKKLLDNGVNGLNDSVAAVMEAVNNPTPENIQKAFNMVLQTIGTAVGDLQSAMNRNLTTDIQNGGVTVVSQLVSESTGLDYNMVHRQFTGMANQLQQGAEAYKAQMQQAWAQQQAAQVQARQSATINSNDTTLITNIPNPAAPSVTLNNGPVASVPEANSSVVPNVHNIPAPEVKPPKATVTAPAEAAPPVVEVATPAEAAPVQQAPAPVAPAPVEQSAPMAPAPAPVEAPAPPAPIEAPAQPAPVEVAPQPAPAPAPAPAPVAQVAPQENRVVPPVVIVPPAPAASVPSIFSPSTPVITLDTAPKAPTPSVASLDPELAAAS